MKHLIENRREFLKHASIAAMYPFLLSCKADTLAQRRETDVLGLIKKNAVNDPTSNWTGAKDVPADVSWSTKLAPVSDKGERIYVSGTVFGLDGRTPASNALIYLYHTDIYGIYGREGELRHGRYRGWMLTDAKGRYEFESIKPASYPNSTIASHIHMTVTTETIKEDWVDSILFEGDRFITQQERVVRKGGFDPILKFVKSSDGISRGVRNIQLWG